MKRSLKLFGIALLGAAAVFAVSLLSPTTAQVQNPPNVPANNDLGAVVTNTLRTAGTVQVNGPTNLYYRGVICTLNMSAISGSPSVTFAIQAFDAASSSWTSLATSTASTAASTPNSISVYPGNQTSSLPSGVTAAASLHLPRAWRLSQTVGGSSTPATTGTIGCNYLN
jgi:hypothetical protein